MRFDGVLLASDYDGTLTGSDGTIPPRNVEKIREFIREGGLFTVCTGRTFQGCHFYDPSLINAPVLQTNGAAAYDYAARKYLFCDGLRSECFAAVEAIYRDFPTVGIELYPLAEHEAYTLRMTPDSARHFAAQDIVPLPVTRLSETAPPFQKVMIAAQGGFSAGVQALLDKHPEVRYLPTSGDWVEILKKGVDKGAGLAKLARLLGCKPQNVYGIGDGYNDLDMKRGAAAFFVPSDGAPEALAAATEVVAPRDEGAVAAAIERLEERYA